MLIVGCELYPIAVELLKRVEFLNAEYPIAVLFEPLVVDVKQLYPKAVLQLPVVILPRTDLPIPQLSNEFPCKYIIPASLPMLTIPLTSRTYLILGLILDIPIGPPNVFKHIGGLYPFWLAELM